MAHAVDNPRKSLGSGVSLIGVVEPEQDAVYFTLLDTSKTVQLAKLSADAPYTAQRRQDEMAVEAVLGVLSMTYNPECSAYEVNAAAAQRGYGPALYDIAMTFAQIVGTGGVVPDRGSVSEAAQRVWERSLDRRRDVFASPISSRSCPTHEGRDALNHVFSRRTPFREYNGLIRRGEKLGEQLVAIWGTEEAAYAFVQYLRNVFWSCKYRGVCPSPSVWARAYRAVTGALS